MSLLCVHRQRPTPNAPFPAHPQQMCKSVLHSTCNKRNAMIWAPLIALNRVFPKIKLPFLIHGFKEMELGLKTVTILGNKIQFYIFVVSVKYFIAS